MGNDGYSFVFAAASAALATAAAGMALWTAWRTISAPDITIKPSTENDYSHIDPDTLDPEERQQLLEQFSLACEYMNGKEGKKLKLGNADKLRFYAFYKTATVGPNDTPKPSLIDFERSAMWNAWSELNGTAKIEAMISYVEQVHRLDPEWRDKVTSKALARVLGENSTLACDSTRPESEDEDDKLFLQANAKSREQRDEERRVATENRVLREKQEQQRLLKLKFGSLTGSTKDSAGNDIAGATAAAEASNQDEDAMGPVFSSPSKVADGPTLEATTVKILDHVQETDGNVVDDDVDSSVVVVEVDGSDEEGEKKKDATAIVDKARNKSTSSGTILRVFAGKFYELTALEDLTLFQEVIEQENVNAIVSQDDSINPQDLKNDQDLLFSHRVVLVDLHRVTLLHQVAESGTAPQCGILLHTFKYPLDLPDADGNTPLMVAIGNENVEMVKYLVSQGANLFSKSADGESIEELIGLCDNKSLKEFLKQAIGDAKSKQ